MPEEPQPMPLSYESPPPRGSWVPRFNGWWAVLASLPVFLFWWLPATRSTSDYSFDPKYTAAVWASIAIGVRAAVGIIRRERNWAWLLYLPLYVLLPEVAEVVTRYAFKFGWVE